MKPSVGWAKLPGTAMMMARRRAILPTRLHRESQELPHPLIPADAGIQTLPNCTDVQVGKGWFPASAGRAGGDTPV